MGEVRDGQGKRQAKESDGQGKIGVRQETCKARDG